MFKSFKEKDFYYPLLIWALIAFWYLGFVYVYFELAQRKTQDFICTQAFYMLPRPPEQTQEVVIVAIDEFSRRKLNLKWPWPRNITAQLIGNISAASPKVIGLDMVFSGESLEAQDQELVAALQSYPRIVAGYKLGAQDDEFPLERFRQVTKAVGYVDRPLEKSRIPGRAREIDKVIRSISTFYVKAGEEKFSIDLEIIANYLDIPRNQIKLDLERGIWLNNDFFIPSPGGITALNYTVHYNGLVSFPAALVLENKVAPEMFKDKIVLVGATDHLIHDEHLTPLGLFPGVSILANSLIMLLSQRFIHNLAGWQTFLIIVFLSVTLLYLNKKLTFIVSSAVSFLILCAAFLGALLLRSRDIQFDYFSVFFLSLAAFTVSNIYKYSYLSFMKNKLRDLAIKDPLTGFYNLRYFLLKLDEQLKSRPKELTFLALVIANYRRLILHLSFEQIKSLIKMLSEYAQSSTAQRFKKVEFVRISQDILGLAVWEENKEQVEQFFERLIEKLKQVDYRIGEQVVKLTLQGILLHKPKQKRMQSSKVIYHMEAILQRLKKEPDKKLFCQDLEEELWDGKQRPEREDILDFLTSDLDARNKDLEQALKELLESKQETEQAYFDVIYSLVKALEEKDTYTQGHAERVANYALEIARQVGLSDEQCQLIYRAGLLHDIGKIGLSENLLHKKGKLSQQDIEQIRKHSVISVEILKPIKAFQDLLPIILHHHEYFDGSGYPHGLSGDMIPRGAQILAVADAFDAITSGRGYKKGKSRLAAWQELERFKQRYNPEYLQALKKVLKL